MANIDSLKIKVFPSAKRNDAYDRNARLNSEQNLISTVNRLTSKKSFIISGLKVTQSSKTSSINITAGSCNLYGYLFNLNDLTIDNITPNKEEYLAFRIQLKTTELTTNLQFTQLIALDTDGTTDLDGTSKFLGMEVTTIGKTDYHTNDGVIINTDTNVTTCYLPIAECKNTTWETIYANDGITPDKYVDEFRHRWNALKIKASDIQVEGLKDNTANYYNSTQDLATFLRENYILDDGEIA